MALVEVSKVAQWNLALRLEPATLAFIGMSHELVGIDELGYHQDWYSEQNEKDQVFSLTQTAEARSVEKDKFVRNGLQVGEWDQGGIHSHEDRQKTERDWQISYRASQLVYLLQSFL